MARRDDVKSLIAKKQSDLEELQVEEIQLPQPPPGLLKTMGVVKEELYEITREIAKTVMEEGAKEAE